MKNNYRKIYETLTKTKIPKGYDIHHIDFNRENNNIMNLVMLPKKLHSKYHTKLQMYKSLNYKIITKLNNSIENGIAINQYIKNVNLKVIEEFIDVWYECMEYVYYRDFLLGIIPYAHNINIEV